jgi:hypothetical protein
MFSIPMQDVVFATTAQNMMGLAVANTTLKPPHLTTVHSCSCCSVKNKIVPGCYSKLAWMYNPLDDK